MDTYGSIELRFSDSDLAALARLSLTAHEQGAEVHLWGDDGGGDGHLTVKLEGYAKPNLEAAAKLVREAENA